MALKLNDVERRFSEIVANYIRKGYSLYIPSMNSSDGTYRVDLHNDNEFVRVFMEKDYDGKLILKLCIGKCTLKNNTNIHSYVYKSSLETKEIERFYSLNNEGTFFTDAEGYRSVRKKINDRYNIRYDMRREKEKKEDLSRFVTHKLVEKVRQTLPRCKTLKADEIKIIKHSSTNAYCIFARGHKMVLK